MNPPHPSPPPTQERPKVCGFYWVRSNRNPWRQWHIRRFVRMKSPSPDCQLIQPEDGPFSTEGWDWFAGPLNPPDP